jgi:hypothetical protein
MATNEPEQDIPEIRLDKTKLTVTDVSDHSDEIEYWRNTTTKERLQHLERLRRAFYGAKATARIQKVIEVLSLEKE